MKKILKFSEIDCANCAAKVEKNINKLETVKSARVVFLTGKIILEVEDNCDIPTLIKAVEKEAKKIEPDCEITE